MPNIFTGSQSISEQGYLSNRFQAAGSIPVTAVDVNKTYSTSSMPAVTNPDPWFAHVTKATVAAPADVIDSVAALFGNERGAFNKGLYDSIGMPGFGRWVEENHGSVEIASGLMGAVTVGAAAEMAAAKVVQSGWFAATGLGKVVTPLIQRASAAQAVAAQETLAAAQAGRTLGIWEGANRNAMLWSIGTGVLKAGVSEAAIVAVMNKNSAIWSEDMGQNMLFGALGLGIGGGLGAISGRGQLYRWANSDEVRYARAQIADPSGIERGTAKIPAQALTGGTPAIIRESAEITSLAMNARRVDDPTVNPVTSERRATQTQLFARMQDKLQAWTRKGTPELPSSAFTVGSPQTRHLQEALHDDPLSIYGAMTVGRINGSVEDALKSRQNEIDTLLKSQNPADTAKGRELSKQQPLILVNKQWMTPREAKPFTETRVVPGDFTFQSGTDQVTWKSRHTGKQFTVNENGKVNANYQQLTIPDIINVTEAMSRMMDRLKSKNLPFVLTKDADFYQLDAAIEFENRGGVVDWGTIGDSARAQLKSLQLKSAIVNPANGAVKLDAHMRFRLNLPQMSAAERIADPKGIGLRSILKAAGQPGIDIPRLQAMRTQVSQTLGLGANMPAPNALDGGIYGFNRVENKPTGAWHEPVAGFFTDQPPPTWHQWNLEDQVFETKTARYRELGSRKKAPLMRRLTETILSHPSLKQAWDITGLSDDMLAGTDNVVGASASQLLTQAMRFRNVPALKAAQELRRVVNRLTELHIDEVYERLTPVLSKLNEVSGAKSKVLLNQYLSNSAGWEIAATTATPDGMTAFVLRRDSQINEARLGRPVNPGEFMVNPKSGKPIVLDPLADSARKAIEAETTSLLHERNAVRAARGIHEITHKAFYVPPPKTTGKIVGMTFDSRNRAVPGGAIIADTKEQFKAAVDKLKLKPGEKFMTLDEVRAFADLWDEAELDFIDPTRMAGPGGVNRGALSSADINPNAVQDVLDFLKKGYEENATGAVRTIFDSQLGTTKVRSAAETAVRGEPKAIKNIWQTYEETLLGLPAGINARGLTGLLQEVDNWVDGAIAVAWPAMRVSREGLRNMMSVLGVVPGSKWFGIGKVKSFADLQNELAQYMPFTQAMDYAQYTKGITPPWTSKDISRTMNRIGSGIILRWLEMPHAVMNMTGIITNMPGLVNNTNVPIVGKVGGVGVVDSMKIMAKGFKRMLRETSGADWDMMVRNGDTTQDVAELHKQLALVQDKSGFMKFMTGDPQSKSFIRKKGLEGMASIIADTSESMSRRWAHFVGLELADYHGVTGMEARHQFARNIANDAIANYDPLNRPEIYNSGIGSMYGLFLSYAQNYYQRMFRWMEAGDYKAVGQSLAMQAAMFGFAGVPGFRQIAAMMGESDKDGDGKSDGLMDGIYERWGPHTGSVIAHGTFDQLVTLFGLPATAMFTRGDANFRHPAGDFATTGQIPLPAGVEAVKDILEGVTGVVGGMINPKEPMSARYAAEVMSRTMPSRALKGALTVMAAGGQDVDANGNVMAEIKSTAEAVYRFLGIRSSRQQANIEAYFMNMNSQRIDAARRETLREKTKALVRGGHMDRLPEVFQGYIDSGGMPWNYASWLQEVIEDAPNTRTKNQLLDSMKSPAMRELSHRIELFTGGNY